MFRNNEMVPENYSVLLCITRPPSELHIININGTDVKTFSHIKYE